jgi:hypothetical protein
LAPQIPKHQFTSSVSLRGTSKNTISPCVEATIAYNLDS